MSNNPLGLLLKNYLSQSINSIYSQDSKNLEFTFNNYRYILELSALNKRNNQNKDLEVTVITSKKNTLYSNGLLNLNRGVRLYGFTKRECKIIDYICKGSSNKNI